MVATPSSRQQLPALLDLDIDRQVDLPVFRQIATRLREHIGRGVLPAGTRLPPSRELATQLAVARNCVIDAYDELIADGLLEGRGRHGTFVAANASAKRSTKKHPNWAPSALRRHTVHGYPVPVPDNAAFDWRPGLANARSLPLDAWRTACREAGRHLPPQGYGDPRGDQDLRRAIVRWLHEHRSVRVEPEQIVVTQGTGQALTLITQALLRTGDRCATEDPGYAGAAVAFLRAGASLRYVPVDGDGIRVDDIVERQSAPVMVHITPTHQYPMGGRLSGPRRRALIELARQHGTLILENEYDFEFNYAGTNHPPVFSSAPESTLLLSTFAKAVSPALRLGFITAPPEAANVLAAFIERERSHVSWPAQKVIEQLMVSGELDRHLRRVRRHYAAIREAIRERLAVYQSVIEITGDEGGLHVVVCGRTRALDRKLQATLRAQGVLFDCVRQFATLDPDANGLLFAYGHMDTEMLVTSLDQLERCVKEMSRR
jgi:GntR family transcriptional regulator / MocR family aminotransferase